MTAAVPRMGKGGKVVLFVVMVVVVVVVVVIVVVVGEEVEKVRHRQNVCWKCGVGCGDGFCCCYCCCCCGKEIS